MGHPRILLSSLQFSWFQSQAAGASRMKNCPVALLRRRFFVLIPLAVFWDNLGATEVVFHLRIHKARLPQSCSRFPIFVKAPKKEKKVTDRCSSDYSFSVLDTAGYRNFFPLGHFFIGANKSLIDGHLVFSSIFCWWLCRKHFDV